jgi:hypothetical protein
VWILKAQFGFEVRISFLLISILIVYNKEELVGLQPTASNMITEQSKPNIVSPKKQNLTGFKIETVHYLKANLSCFISTVIKQEGDDT